LSFILQNDKERYHSAMGSMGGNIAQDVISVVSGAAVLPKPFAPDKDAVRRFIEFFAANIRYPDTRGAYAGAPSAVLSLSTSVDGNASTD
jgi:hypothetical protein